MAQPIGEGRQPSRRSAGGAGSGGGPPLFFAMDADPGVLRMVRSLVDLVWPGAPVCTSTSARSGLELARQAEADVIVAALDVAERDGLDLTAELAADEALCQAKVILVVGAATPGDRERLAGRGAFRVLTRPLRRIDLATALQAAARTYSS